MKIGILTGGGDCPGLNAVIRGAVRASERRYDDTVIGFLDGWSGVLDDRYMPLDVEACRGILPRGGTIIGTSRITPFMFDDGVDRCRETMERNDIEALICIGGEGTLTVTNLMFEQGFPVVGVPKTIDNDVGLTEMTFGFETAVEIATDAIDRLHTTAESHNRVMVVEVMGRHAGHIATWAGIGGGATVTLVPEEPFDIGEVCQSLVRRHSRGPYASVVVVAEGAVPVPGTLELADRGTDEFGHKRLEGISTVVAEEIERQTGFETRVTILGHVQRGGTPSAFDRVLSTWYGVESVKAVHDEAFGQMIAFQNADMTRVSLAEATAELKLVNPSLHDVAKIFQA